MYILYAYAESFRLTSGFLTPQFYVIRNLLKSEFNQPPVTLSHLICYSHV